MNKSYYFDMDGVIAKYEKDAYVGENPRWLRKNEHYFLNLEPDRKILEFIDLLHQRCRYTGDNIYILTSLPVNGAIFNEHFHDKISYINKWLPYIDINHILISVTSKRDCVEYIHDHNITENDILIDDFNLNLTDWELAGGKSVKYCNGINNPDSFDGYKLFYQQPAPDMVKFIESI